MQFWCNLLPAEHVRLKSIVALRLNRMVSSVLRVCMVFLRVCAQCFFWSHNNKNLECAQCFEGVPGVFEGVPSDCARSFLFTNNTNQDCAWCFEGVPGVFGGVPGV